MVKNAWVTNDSSYSLNSLTPQHACLSKMSKVYNKKLLVEIEHVIINYLCKGLSYLLKAKAEADNTDMRFNNP